MNSIISLIYAPVVFISLRYFDIKVVSIIVFFLSLLWMALIFNQEKKNLLYPALYLFFSVVAFFLENFLILKLLPLIISIAITAMIIISYINKNSIIFYFANKFSKSEITKEEQEYIQSSTLFWAFIACINVFFHWMVFINENVEFWVYYSSIGWYIIFIIAGIVQFLHRKFVFLKRVRG